MSYDWSIVKFGDFAEAHELIKGRLEVRKPLGEWLLKRPEPHLKVEGGLYLYDYDEYFRYDVTDNDIQEFFRTNPHLLETVTTDSSLQDSSPDRQPPATAKTAIPGRPLPPTRITAGTVSRPSVPPPATRTRSEPVKVTLSTPLQDVVAHLTEDSGITNLTDQLNRSLTLSDHPIANGGQADVYRASRSDGTRFAVKCLRYHDTKLIKHTAKELHTWSKLDHANILKLTGLAVFQNRIAMVSPWMEYGSVSSLIADQPDQDRYELCKQLADAVEYLHNSNVVHGDIKGANLLVDSDGMVKLTDFGLAILHDQSIQFSHTTPGGGTARWMAPELFEDDTELSRETDVYAMGMTMLEIITGELPFPHLSSWMSIFKAVSQKGSTPSIEKLQMEPLSPRAQLMIGVLHRCWRYDPKERATATEVAGIVKFIGPV